MRSALLFLQPTAYVRMGNAPPQITKLNIYFSVNYTKIYNFRLDVHDHNKLNKRSLDDGAGEVKNKKIE